MERWERLRWVARLCLTGVSLVVVVAMTPAWLALLRPAPAHPRDFFQDYASARNLLLGRPVYEDQAVTLRDYLGIDTSGREVNIRYNAHPPTSVLLALPLARLDYVTAGWWWNVVSLGLLALSGLVLARGVGWRPTPWAVVPTLALLMTWVPLWLHTLQGQLGLVLLALFTSAWAAGRRGRLSWCGIMLGVAATIKLFPILLLGLLARPGQWRGLVVGGLAAVVTTLLTALVTGPAAFVTYATVVVPNLNRWRADWINSSLTGFFAHLFAPDHLTQPLVDSPALALALTAASSLAVIAVVARWALVYRDFDGVYALALTGLLLLSTLTWSHYFVVLLLPLAIWLRRLWRAGRRARGRWVVLLATWLLMALSQRDLAVALVPGGADGVASPALALTVLALNFYGLLGFFVAQAWWLAADARRGGAALTLQEWLVAGPLIDQAAAPLVTGARKG